MKFIKLGDTFINLDNVTDVVQSVQSIQVTVNVLQNDRRPRSFEYDINSPEAKHLLSVLESKADSIAIRVENQELRQEVAVLRAELALHRGRFTE